MSVILKSVSRSFGKKQVLKNLTYTFEKGSRTVLIGASGVGKTTLFRIISGLDKRYSGICNADGKIALVFQEDRLFDSASVIENVCAVSPERERDDAEALLSDLGLADSINSLPSSLSGGMRRRVAIARALFFGGDILLLDECFTGLDGETKKLTADIINRETKGKTLILITHDSSEAELLGCDSKLVI